MESRVVMEEKEVEEEKGEVIIEKQTIHYHDPERGESMSSSSMDKHWDHHHHHETVSAGSMMMRSSGLIMHCKSSIQEVILGTRLSVLFPAIPLAIIAERFNFGRPWLFASSLVGLTVLAERLSFLTEQFAFYAGPTVGGLLTASCGNVTELVISIFALCGRKYDVVKYSLLGSILSNLLFVLGSSLFCGGLANQRQDQKYDVRHVRTNSLLLLTGLLSHMLPVLFHHASGSGALLNDPTLQMSRASGTIMLIAYAAYLIFQLKTHRQRVVANQQDGEEESEELVSSDIAVIGYWSAFAWLAVMTALIALLSEYIVNAIEDASHAWGLSVRFISIIVLPIVGNAAEHASAIIFSLRNKLDISLGVALGSATQISMFVIPLNVVVGWMLGIPMNLDLKLFETVSLAFAILITIITLQDGSSHYMKGFILLLGYITISACFFVLRTPHEESYALNVGVVSAFEDS